MAKKQEAEVHCFCVRLAHLALATKICSFKAKM